MKPSDQLRQNIRDIREDKHLTQADMAEKLNLSETGYAKIERGESKLNIDRIQQIANVLEVNLADLIPLGDDAVIIFNNSNDNFSNSNNFSLAFGNNTLEQEIAKLHELLIMKNDVISSREREIELLKQQVATLNELVSVLNQNKSQ